MALLTNSFWFGSITDHCVLAVKPGKWFAVQMSVFCPLAFTLITTGTLTRFRNPFLMKRLFYSLVISFGGGGGRRNLLWTGFFADFLKSDWWADYLLPVLIALVGKPLFLWFVCRRTVDTRRPIYRTRPCYSCTMFRAGREKKRPFLKLGNSGNPL